MVVDRGAHLPDEGGLDQASALSEYAFANPGSGGRHETAIGVMPARFSLPRNDIYVRVLKRYFDIAGACTLLVILSPIIVATGIVVLLLDGWPIVFAQERIGLDCRIFRFYKFRTMVRGAEGMIHRWKEENPALWKSYIGNMFKISGDPRVIPLTRFLRQYSIDELPQLWNVVRGDMSLVGPRPLVKDELAYYERDAILYGSVRPGVTGLWQVSGRSETSPDTRETLDGEYLETISFLGDLKVLLRTIPTVLSGLGAY